MLSKFPCLGQKKLKYNATYPRSKGFLQSFIKLRSHNNVVQVCTDNAPIMTAASHHIFQSISHLYVQGCAAHCLDLLLEDWGKEEWMKKLVKKARIISVFIKSHHAS